VCSRGGKGSLLKSISVELEVVRWIVVMKSGQYLMISN
jgi:hypothetical protein